MYGQNSLQNLRKTPADCIKRVSKSAESGIWCWLLTFVVYFASLWCTLRLACCRRLIIFYIFGCVVFAVFVVVDKTESRSMNLGSEVCKKRAAMIMEEGSPSKAAPTGAPSDKRRLEAISVPRLQDMQDEEVEVDQLMRARDVKDGTVLSLVWENPGDISYAR